jgi:hypothetical protein
LLIAKGCPPNIVDVLAALPAAEQAVLRSGRGRLVAYLCYGARGVAWFSVEPTGLRRIG